MSEQMRDIKPQVPTQSGSWDEIDVGTKVDQNGKTTYHVLRNESNVGFFVEKLYGNNNNLVKIVKRGRTSRSETDFDPITGDVARIFEAATLPDGSSMTKEISYVEAKTIESVLVIGQDGDLRSSVQRESIGIRTLYQGQTDYRQDGSPDTTVSHHMNHETGKLEHREQIKWLKDGQRTLTEHFYFSTDGKVNKYTKLMYHACGGPFLEETHRYGPTGHMLRREIIQYNPNGVQTACDLTTYDVTGDITHRSTTYYDHRGTAIVSHEQEISPLSFKPPQERS
ncbi:hypothetical protein GC174_08570 [bacterium]|nr:hypothetical protein [bacterium]MCB9471305.1 hypothetical protein [Candidatus Obscuribacterales bacterium]